MNKYILFISFLFVYILSVQISNAQWQPDVRLTNDPAGSFTNLNNARCVSARDNFVHVVWNDSRDGNEEIYYKRSSNFGISWGTDTRLTTNSAISWYPSVSASGSVVHVVWNDIRDGNDEIYYKRSTDAGVSWGADTRLTTNSAISLYPSLSASGSVVHVVWHDYRDGTYPEIYYKRSTDEGVSWGADTRLTNNTASSIFASVSSDYTGFVDVVWTDGRDTNSEIYYKGSVDAGASWGADTRLTNNPGESFAPSVYTFVSYRYVAWIDDRDGNNEVYFKRITGGTIGDIRLTNNPTIFKFHPSIVTFGEIIHVVWQDGRDGNWEIYYKRSDSHGQLWGADTRLTNNPGDSHYPSIATSGQRLHVVWSDTRDGNQEIYYKRDPNAIPFIIQTSFPRNNLNKPIIDYEYTADIIRLLFEAPVTYSVLDVNLQIDTVLHTNDSDLEFYLIHEGVTDTIIYQVGGSGDNFIGTILNDSAATLISNGTAPFTGLYRPHKPLSQFNNMNVNGEWTLKIYDRAAGNTGVLNAWTLIITIQINPIGIQPIGTEIPKGFSLSQNYPNPFNPSTVIKFQVPSLSGMKIVVFDVLGKEVAILVNENLNAGTYEVDWDGSNFGSGVYYYKLSAGDYLETRKMILLK